MYLRVMYNGIGLMFWMCCCIINASAQVTFEILRHQVNEDSKTIDLFISGLDDGQSIFTTRLGDYAISEVKIKDTLSRGKMDIIGKVEKYGEAEFKLLFLIDKSGSMRGEKFRKAKAAIKSALVKYALPDNVASFAVFNETFSSSKPLSLKNFNILVQPIRVEPEGSGKDTHLYYTLQEKLKEWKSFKGRKVIILLTDGQDDIRRNGVLNEPFASRGVNIVTQSSLLTQVQSLDSLFAINCIGFGADVDSLSLKKIVRASPSPNDKYSFAATPDDIGEVIQKATRDQAHNLKLSIRPIDFCEYIGSSRKLSVEINYKDTVRRADLYYSYGHSAGGMENLCGNPDNQSFMTLLPYDLGLVGGLFVLFVTLLPWISNLIFRRKHVKRYKEVKVSGVIKRDPITTEILQDNDLVVAGVCKHVNLYQSWKDNDDQCGEKNCHEGYSRHSTSTNFFSQSSDITRRLNWIWFGALGGGLGWILDNLFYMSDKENYSSFFSLFSKEGGFDPYYQALNMGAGLGLGIALAFAYVEERGQSRKLNWGRIAIRGLLGLILGGLVFVMTHLVFSNVTQQLDVALVEQLISWLLFGMLVALLVSVNSAIELRSAVLSGIFASIAGFSIFYLFTETGWIANEEIGKIFGMVTYGAVLGIVMDTVRSSLEDFHLEYISPSYIRRKNPISKWLKGGVPELNIGNDTGSYVHIKWDPAVKGQHASLTYEDGKVFITPKAQTIVNGTSIRGKTVLHNNDIIKLGEESITSMRFMSSQKKENKHQTSNLKRTIPDVDFLAVKNIPTGGDSNTNDITFH